MNDGYISLAHGNGGHYMRELIEKLFVRHLSTTGIGVRPRHLQLGPERIRPGDAVLETELGGHRMLEELEDDPLPRIC